MAWEQDIYLNQLRSRIDHYDIFSFDVFDTLLLRTCGESDDVFELAGAQLMSSSDNWRYSPEAYKGLRKEAEQRARVKKALGTDCSLADIIAEMPFSPSLIEQIADTEISCEKLALYLNDNIYSFMRFLVEKNKKIVLISDMYLDKEHILYLLTCVGVNTDIIAECFVSSEHCRRKVTGELFREMLSAFPDIDPSNILHIGDNLISDIGGAKKAGIAALHYPVVPRDFGSFYDFERYIYKIRLGELLSLRKLAAVTRQVDMDESKVAFYSLGAEVIGPVYALFADWVVQYAEKRNVNVILPFMREGELLSRVIERSARQKSTDIECVPVYISRQPVFTASIYADNYDERISQVLLRGGRTVKAVFDELGLNLVDFQKSVSCSNDTTLDSLRKSGQIEALESFIKSSDARNTVLAWSEVQRKHLLKYMSRIMKGRPVLTVDIGSKGTTERYLHDIWIRENCIPKLLHTLMIGSGASNAANILDGIDITAWLGIAGENDAIISKIKYQIQVIEAFVNAVHGSTLRYEDKAEGIIPVLEAESVPESQKRMVNVCWEGVETFQKLWLSLSNRKPGLREYLLGRKKDFLNIFLRFIEMPTMREAEQFGSLLYSDEFNSDKSVKLACAAPPESPDLTDNEIKAFIAASLKNGCYWPQAAVAIGHPEYFSKRLLRSFDDDPAIGVMLTILNEIESQKLGCGAIFGAAELGRKFRNLAAILKVEIACFVDSDERLHGTAIEGVPVIPLWKLPDNIAYFVIASYAYSEQIRAVLQAHYAGVDNKPRLFFLSPD